MKPSTCPTLPPLPPLPPLPSLTFPIAAALCPSWAATTLNDLEPDDRALLGSTPSGTTVRACRHRRLPAAARPHRCAVKAIPRAAAARFALSAAHVMGEKAALVAARAHPLCLRLLTTLKDEQHLYFVTELVGGGTGIGAGAGFVASLRERRGVDDDVARCALGASEQYSVAEWICMFNICG